MIQCLVFEKLYNSINVKYRHMRESKVWRKLFIGQATIFVSYSKPSNALIIQCYVFGKLFTSIDDQFISMHAIHIDVISMIQCFVL